MDNNIISGKELERHFGLQQAQFEFARMFDYGSNDREIAIIGGAFLDTILENILFSFLVDDQKEVARVPSRQSRQVTSDK